MGGGGGRKGLGPRIIIPPLPGANGGLGGGLSRPSLTGGLSGPAPVGMQKPREKKVILETSSLKEIKQQLPLPNVLQ